MTDTRSHALADPWADARAHVKMAYWTLTDQDRYSLSILLAKDAETLLAALDAVRARHFQQVGGLPSCYFDGEAFYPCARCGQRWPCETTRDIAAALDGAT